MGNRKDIGKLFNERFKDFEQAPGADLWDNIASELDQKSDRKIAPFWLYFGGVLIVGMLTGLLYWAPWSVITSPNIEEQPSIVNTTQPSQNNTSVTSSSSLKNTTTEEVTNAKSSINTSSKEAENKNISTNNDTTNSTSIRNTATTIASSQNKNSENSQIVTTTKTTNKNTSNSNNSANTSSLSQTTSYTSTQKNDKTASIIEVLRTMKSASQEAREQKELEARTAYQAKIKEELATAIAAQKEDSKITTQKWLDSLLAIEKAEKIKKEALAITVNKEEEQPIKEKTPKLPKTKEEREKDRKESVNYKFAVSPYTSLLSYGSLTKGSSIDNRLVDNPRDAIGTIGYGIRADYKFSERSSIRFGIGVAPLQYRTNNFQVLITNNNVNIFQLSGIDPQTLGQTGGIEPSPEALAFFNSNDVVSIEQNISYVEVPVDYQYRFLNKRLSMSFNTGLSLFVLTNNRVFATANSGESIFIGRETSLKDLSLALNLGLGTYYNFSNNWRFDVEPAFKYQLNPYSDNIGNFKPYYFGLQFGISYKF
ncbi:hypothetical protein [uncultured Dokdonia sp.]|uniref:hypothetical protein n=1 Tax=uncultured Dokdonia sp. TaxID=575653 RepID=UPI0026140A62|nr:hypothetical protein [uncultured Dokdonia sp.]